MSLVPCANVVGEEQIFSGFPPIRVIEDAIYVPLRPGSWMDWDTEWGVYTNEGELVKEAAYRRGPGPVLVGQSLRRDLRGIDAQIAPRDTYVYGGLAIGHYGHFLLSTLSRHWCSAEDNTGAPMLYHETDHPLGQWRERPFVASCLDAAGFKDRSIVSFDVPTRISRLIVPAPAFEETYGAHQAFRDLAVKVAGTLTRDASQTSNRLVYFSKEQLSHGIRRVINEHEVTSLLSRRGVDIVFPEQLLLSEQIDCFNKYDLVIGTLGSALHTSIFCSDSTKILALNHDDNILSNFKIIDSLTRCKSLYLRPNSSFREIEELEGFYSNIYWDRPDSMADSIMAVAEIL